MRQIIHIFKKDVRHHWPEILLCQAALALFVWVEIDAWTNRGFYFGIFSFWHSACYWLLPVCWSLLMVRTVQGESLVGDNQFWITRPYEWRKLLGAKMLIILACISLPMLCAQIFFLKKADFLALHYVPGLFWMQLALTSMAFLPLMAMATVAKNMAQNLLVLLAVVGLLGGMLGLDMWLDKDSAMSSADASDWIQYAIVITACVTAIWLQYRHRRTGRARLFLTSGAVVIAIMVLVSPYVIHGEADYPIVPDGNAVPFQGALSPITPQRPKSPALMDEAVTIQLPITGTGLTEGFIGQVNGVQLTLALPDGFQWKSKWEYGGPYLLLPGQNGWIQSFTLSYKDFQRLMPGPVRAKVSMALSFFRDQDAREIRVKEGVFAIEGVGRCQINGYRASSLECLAPLVKPETLLVITGSNQSTCDVPSDSSRKAANETFYDWERNSHDQPAEYGINPVVSFSIFLQNHQNSIPICPGTPLRISFPRFVERRRVEFEVEKIDLNAYRMDSLVGDRVYRFR